MNHYLKVLIVSLGLCHAEQSGLPATNTPLSEIVRGAFINYWPLLNRPDLQHLRSESLKTANFQDTDDCAKKLLCELSRKKDRTWDEDLLYTYYNKPVDYMSESLFFNIAVQVGKDGERDCQEAYPSCFLKLSEMLKLIRRQGISFELPAEELECHVHVVWRKKHRTGEFSKIGQKSLQRQQPAPIELFKTQSKVGLINKDSGHVKDAAKSIEIARTRSESLLRQDSGYKHRVVNYTSKSNSTVQQKRLNGENEFIKLRSEKQNINETEPENLNIDPKLTSYMDQFKHEAPETNHDNENETDIDQNKSLLKVKTQAEDIGGLTDQAVEILETKSKNIEINHRTASGIINSLVGFARKNPQELQNNNLEKETSGMRDKDEVAHDTNMFREGAWGGVIGGVIGGILGVYRSFV